MEIKFYARYGKTLMCDDAPAKIVAHKCSDIIFEIKDMKHGILTLNPLFLDLIKAVPTDEPVSAFYKDKEDAQHLAPIKPSEWLCHLVGKNNYLINEDLANAAHHLPTKKSDTVGCFVTLYKWWDNQAFPQLRVPAIRVSDYTFGIRDDDGKFIPAVDLATNQLIPLPNNLYLSKEECELDAHIPIIDFDD